MFRQASRILNHAAAVRGCGRATATGAYAGRTLSAGLPAPRAEESSATRKVAPNKEIWGHGQMSRSHLFKPMYTVAHTLPRWFAAKAQGGTVMNEADDISSPLYHATKNDKEINDSKVIAFSPLEGTRKSGLGSESFKIKRMELSQKITYSVIPALLLISKTKLTTSFLVLSVYWQIYGFFKEIFLDYVHQEVTRKWVLVYFQLLLLILAKDTILAFDLVNLTPVMSPMTSLASSSV